MARVGDSQADVTTGDEILQRSRPLAGDRLVCHRNRQASTLGHRVARVCGEIHQHLIELTRIAVDIVERRIALDRQLNVFADQPAQERLQVADDAR